jgi:hypothetical protein
VQLPVTLVPRPSLALAGALVAAHGVAALGILPTSLPPVLKFACLLALAASLVFYSNRHLGRPPVAAMILKSDGRMELERRDGARIEAAVHPQTTVFAWLVVLLLRTETGTLALTLPLDALGVDGHRKLRLWLRWKAELSAPV